jgi:hypothetical protein
VFLRQIARRVVPRHTLMAWRLWRVFMLGHRHSAQKNGMPVSSTGGYQPWLTFPLIEYLNGIDFSDSDVFEFGAGASTLYWSERARSVTSVELDEAWHATLGTRLPANASVFLEPDGHKYARLPLSLGRKFDVVVVDGAERYRSALTALEILAPGGMVILDNAEWYPNTSDLLRNAGLIEVRFNGFGPINAFPSTSSVFLSRDSSFRNLPDARKPCVGGRNLPSPAADDTPFFAKSVQG